MIPALLKIIIFLYIFTNSILSKYILETDSDQITT